LTIQISLSKKIRVEREVIFECRYLCSVAITENESKASTRSAIAELFENQTEVFS